MPLRAAPSFRAACILCQAMGEIVQARTKERAMRTLRSAPARTSKYPLFPDAAAASRTAPQVVLEAREATIPATPATRSAN